MPPLRLLLFLLPATALATDSIVITELSADQSDRALRYDAENIPHLGNGPDWYTAAFDDSAWPTDRNGFGWAYTDVDTNLSAAMRNTSPSCYFRRTFTASAADAASDADLLLDMEWDAGFVAYLNGREIARANLGPENAFVFADQTAFNDVGATNQEDIFNLGPASALLLPGENLIAVQGHNESAGDANFKIDTKLRISGGTTFAGGASDWAYFVGRGEPSGGVADHSLPVADIEFSDWVELHNPTASGVNLSNWWLSDDADTPTKWQFPNNTTIPANGYLIILATGRDVDNRSSGGYLHTSFSLSSGGEDLGLYDETGQPVCVLDGGFPNQRLFHSYGTDPSTGEYRYLGTPTAGRPNTGPTLTARTDAPQLSAPTGFYDDRQTITITAEPGATVRYTLDGTGPTATNGQVYTAPIVTDGPDPDAHIGSIQQQIWLSTPGNTVDDIPVDTPPTIAATYRQSFGVLSNWTNNYATRLKGFLHPPQTGNYTFWIAADEQAALYLSSGPDPSNKTLIAAVDSPVAPRAWDTSPSQKSAAVTLQAGSKYYIEALHKEASGDDHLSVAFSGPGLHRAIIDGDYLSPIDPPTTGAGNSSARFTTLRARAFAPGAIPSRTVTANYLVGYDSRLQTLPAIVLSGDPKNTFFKPNGVTAIAGGSFPGTGNSAVWVLDDINGDYNIPKKRGRPYERPAHLTLKLPDGTVAFDGGIGIRVSGSGHARPRFTMNDLESTTWTGSWRDKPSFNLFFRDVYGPEALSHQLHPDSPVDRYSDLRLRAGKNDSGTVFVRDEFMRRLMGATGQPSSHGILANVFINGHIKGYFNLTERYREDWLNEFYDTDSAWDVRQVSSVESGDNTAYNDAISYMRSRNMADPANYQGMLDRVDVVNYADYILVNAWGATGDWPGNNHVVARPRVPGGKWRFYMWDAEGVLGLFNHTVAWNTFTQQLLSEGGGSKAGENALTRMPYKAGIESPEFRLMFADRIQKHFFDDGALTQDNIKTTWDTLSDELDPTMQALRGSSVNDGVFNSWWPSRRDVLFDQFTAQGLWPTTRAPSFAPTHGGDLPDNTPVTLTNPNSTGTIYYTTDGTDPREFGTGNPAGTTYTAPVTVTTAAQIKARVRRNGNWSPLVAATFSTPALPTLVISEIFYNPPGPDESSEFVEIHNHGPAVVDLTGIHFSDGIDFAFTGGVLGAGGRMVIAKDPTRFNAIHPAIIVSGTYTGSLDNDGETVTLADLAGNTIHSVTYNDAAPWPNAADGDGYSLVLTSTNATPDSPTSWRTSITVNGNPGTSDTLAYHTWKSSHTITADDADRDNDSLNTILEFAFGGDPDTSSSHLLPTAQLDAGTLLVTVSRRIGTDTATITFDTSTDLKTWTPTTAQRLTSTRIADQVESHVYAVPTAAYVRVRANITD